jgi:DNA-binding transcriptional LysR family regulator
MVITDTRLKHLISVAQYKHFGLAAAALGISQPALTKSIQGLETALGVKLLDRERNGTVLTPFGELVLEHGRDLLHGQNELLRRIRQLANLDAGLVKAILGPFPSVVSGYPAAGRLLARHPGLALSLQINNWRGVWKAVIDEQVDFGMAELNELETDSRFGLEPLPQHTGRLFCRPGHPLLNRQNRQPADVFAYPWASTRLPARVTNSFPGETGTAGHFDSLSGDFVPSVEINVPMALACFTTGTDVLVLTSLAMVEQELAARTLVPIPGVAFSSGYGFLWPSSRSISPAALAYMAEIRAVEAEFAQREAHLASVYQDQIAPSRG